MKDSSIAWRKDLHEIVRTYHPGGSSMGVDMIDGLVEAIIMDQLTVIPSSHTHESMTRFVTLITEAREIADHLTNKYGEQVIVEDIEKSKLVS